MRFWEIVLVGAESLAFAGLAVPRLRAVRVLVPVAVLALVVQVLVEGARWPLAPAYGMAAALMVAWLWSVRSGRAAGGESQDVGQVAGGESQGAGRLAGGGSRVFRWPGKGWRVAGRWGGRVLGAVGMVASLAVPLLLPVFRIPEPTGPYGIGTLTYHWTDPARAEILGPDPRARRELMAQIWYPARPDASAPRTPYMEDGEALAAIARLSRVPELTFQHVRQVTSNAVAAAPAVPGRHPVLIFLEGAVGFRQMNTFQVEELVSRGYVVAALDQPYAAGAVTFPGGRTVVGLPRDRMSPLIDHSLTPAATPPAIHGRPLPDGMIPHLAADVPFALDRLAALDRSDPRGILTGRLDLERAGAFGISLGGIVTGQACRLEPRLRACLVMDASMTADVVRDGLRQPAMWITRDAATMRREGWDEAEVELHQRTMRAVYDRLPGDGYFVRMPDTFHADYTDVPAWSPLIRALGLAGPIGAERAHAIVNAYTVAFFDTHLKGGHPALPSFPGVTVETHASDRRPS